jgi:hypothetical protein
MDGWTRAHLGRLADVEAGWREAAHGDTLSHLDLRADTMLVRPTGGLSRRAGARSPADVGCPAGESVTRRAALTRP